MYEEEPDGWQEVSRWGGKSFEVLADSPAEELTVELIDYEAKRRGLSPGEYVLRVMEAHLVENQDDPFA